MTSPGFAAVSKDTGGSENTAAPEGQAEPPSHQGTAAKRGFWDPLLCHRRAAAAPQIPSSMELPKGMGTAHSLLLQGCQQVHFLLLTQPLDFSKLGQTAPAP